MSNDYAIYLGKKIVEKYGIGENNPDSLTEKYIESLNKVHKEVSDFINHKLNVLDKRRLSKILIRYAKEHDENIIVYDNNKYRFYIENRLASDKEFLDFVHIFISLDEEVMFSPETSMLTEKKIIH